MPTYRYQAVHASGRKRQGRLAAANEVELGQHLSQSGFELIHARAQKDKTPEAAWRGAASPRVVATFAAQMAELLGAGFTFIDALTDLLPTLDDKSMHEALSQIARDIQHGSGIALAFRKHPRIFPEIFTAILGSGEASGDLARTFAYLKEFSELRASTHENLRRALRYPLFLIVVAAGVVSFMMVMVVPQVIEFLQSINNQLPLSTRWLIAVSQIMERHAWVIPCLVLGVPLLLGLARRHSSRAGIVIDRYALRMPVFGRLLHRLALARFIHSFGLLYQSGTSILSSLTLTKDAIGNHYLKQQLETAAQAMRHGQPLSVALQPLLPPFAVRMLKVGEHSGQLGKSLHNIAMSCDRQAADATEKFIGALEPALTLLVGSVLAWVVVAVFGPIYGSLGKLVSGN